MTVHDFRFVWPWAWLLLALLLPVAVIAWRRRLPTLLVPSLRGYGESRGGRVPWPLRLPLLLELLGLTLLIAALARPQAGTGKRQNRSEGIDMVLAIDISGSMEFRDLPRPNMTNRELAHALENDRIPPRIQVAKQEVLNFVDQRPHDRIGLVAFAEHAYTICPPTLDHEFLKSQVSQLEANMLGSYTGIAAPLASATARLKDSEARRRVCVLFTDGKDTVPQSTVSPRAAADLAARFDVIIHTVGIGSDNAIRLLRTPLGGVRVDQAPMDQTFDRDLLTDIAASTGGEFFMARDAKALGEVMRRIDALEKVEFEERVWMDYRDWFPVLLAAGLLAVALAFVLEHSVCLRTP